MNVSNEENPLNHSVPPSLDEFLLHTPLYEVVAFDIGEDQAAHNIVHARGTINAPCEACEEGHSIFTVSTGVSRADWAGNYRFSITAQCSRDVNHILFFVVRVEGRTLTKYGQFPSLATLSISEVQKYRKVLPKPFFSELTKAIGLAAHGVGVGSFVYLRRIFEGLVNEAHAIASVEPTWDESAYRDARMNEKIQLLAHQLPPFLVEHKSLYGIMSKGIHELTEQECLNAFPAARLGIEMILDMKLEEKARAEKIKAASAAIQRLSQTQPK